MDGNKTQIRLLAHSLNPHMVCRFLLKMGIEVVAEDSPDDVFHGKFDAARHYALAGDKTVGWWYLQNERMDEASDFLAGGVSGFEWAQNVKLEVIKLEVEQEMFHLSLLYLDLFAPLTADVQPKMEGLAEPEFRLFRV
jgi:hypothetical protein